MKPGDVTLDGPTLAKIFLGEIKTWNDPAIAKLNPSRQAAGAGDRRRAPFRRLGHDLHLDRLPVARSARNGRPRSASTPSVEWPVGIGAKGNEGVANNVGQTKGAIGYVEYAYAKQNKLNYAKMVNKDGKTVAPTSESFQAAAAYADWTGTPGFGVILTDEPGADSWPIAGATFILIHKQPQDPAAASEALKFFSWAYAKGDKMAEESRLRADARQRRHRHPEGLGGGDQGRVRQAAVHRVALIDTVTGEGAAGAFSALLRDREHGLCRGRATA